jgi:hypothetical protein
MATYKLGSVGVQKVRWNKGDTKPADDYSFVETGRSTMTGFLVYLGIISTVKIR